MLPLQDAFDMSMITATSWVPRGFAAPFPQKYVFDDGEFERISQLARLQLDDAKEDLDEAKNGGKSADEEEEPQSNAAAISGVKDDIEIDDDLKEYDLEHYDDDDGAVDKDGEPLGMFGNVKSLVYHENNDDDPYITMPDNVDDDVEREELQILDTDNLVLAARIEDEMAHLEVYVYEDEADNLYVHHDIMLPAIPLTVEWLNTPVGKGPIEEDSRGNFVAVGTMDPDIEIWDLDIVDCMYPNAILGQGAEDLPNGEKPKKKKKKKSKKANDNYHVDAVLSLAANRTHRNLLASSSADKTVKLWDLNTTKYMRAPEAKAPRWGVESDVEQVRWDPHDPNFFYVSTENGVIHYHDARLAPSDPSQTKPIWTLQAHDESISSFDINPVIPGFIATGSTDKEVKLWNVQATGPSMVVSRNLGVGKVFSTTFAPDKEVGFRLAVAGSKGSVQIWDTSTNAAVRRIFANKVAPVEGEVKERLVSVQESDSESESGEDDDNDASDAGPDGWESMDEE
ncbi:putative periodic tryptophan protein 1 protein [Neofusicoccum parvum UCRNP2]|uniref:Putative periodic tryptophan protein 1 protein n=1 Tax=Botryosphaeria parva (strain UCR-NP2) TaxID=1287680 RepID=R1GEN5_BOTPV|nr:putative periodic tryptophan protein 1 protein [Neofusicoccum parvum UCRNP2]